MNCKEIQELILTDYIDARMWDGQKSLIDRHIAHCHACGDFLINAKREIIDPFRNAQQLIPDESLWLQIKEEALMPNFWERVRSALYIPRPAFALATITMMVLMIGPTGQLFINNQLVKINGQDQIEYLSSLIDEPADIADNNGNDPQTPIEKYFL